ncbi:hypothetical protein L1049_022928 [Liquidambar formosana]|uniref:C3H1-type domain-containing protein n=1 Tax=Liquidambar formosana TaxID=63359 RepID=A0AAP0RDA3_LIQFO
MANQLYGYNPTYGAQATTAGLSSGYSSRSLADQYLSDSSLLASSRYLSSDPLASSGYSASSMYLNQNYSSSDYGAYSAAVSRIPGVGSAVTNPSLGSQASWSVDATGAAVDPLVAGYKRPSEALYHQTLLGAHNTIGQSEAWLSSNYLAKRSRFESTSNLPIYPQRPGEKDCAHYMLTRTCKFGDSCKFDHPIWVPEGGIPDWKEVPLIAPSEVLPERPGEPDCPYFLKTQRCKFGLRCKFNHPKDKLASLGAPENVDVSALPERPSEPPCAFYMKTGVCKFGGTCKFHHPKDIQIPLTGQENGSGEQTATAVKVEGMTGAVKLVNPAISVTPALLHNTKGLPIRPGEADCPFYLKTGSCKYGATCRYNHPDRTVFNPHASAIGQAFVASPAASLNIGVVNPAASVLQTVDPRLAPTTLGLGPTIYPQRPGQMECDFYMKSGECKFGERCKFHHPIDRSAPSTKQQENVKLTLAGFPRREGAIICPYYMKTGTCKYGPTCKFDHPPPGEVMAMATSQGTSTSVGGEGKVDEKEGETAQG